MTQLFCTMSDLNCQKKKKKRLENLSLRTHGEFQPPAVMLLGFLDEEGVCI